MYVAFSVPAAKAAVFAPVLWMAFCDPVTSHVQLCTWLPSLKAAVNCCTLPVGKATGEGVILIVGLAALADTTQVKISKQSSAFLIDSSPPFRLGITPIAGRL